MRPRRHRIEVAQTFCLDSDFGVQLVRLLTELRGRVVLFGKSLLICVVKGVAMVECVVVVDGCFVVVAVVEESRGGTNFRVN